jgi:hypothetical protein
MKKLTIVLTILAVLIPTACWAPVGEPFPTWQPYPTGIAPFNIADKVAIGQTPGGSGGIVLNEDGTAIFAGTVTAGAFSPPSGGTTYNAGNGLALDDTTDTFSADNAVLHFDSEATAHAGSATVHQSVDLAGHASSPTVHQTVDLAGHASSATVHQTVDLAGHASSESVHYDHAAHAGSSSAHHVQGAGGGGFTVAGVNLSDNGDTVDVVDDPVFADRVKATGFSTTATSGNRYIYVGNTNDYSGTGIGAQWMNETGGVLRYNSADATAQTVATQAWHTANDAGGGASWYSTMESTLLPDTQDTYNIGAAAKEVATLWVNTIDDNDNILTLPIPTIDQTGTSPVRVWTDTTASEDDYDVIVQSNIMYVRNRSDGGGTTAAEWQYQEDGDFSIEDGNLVLSTALATVDGVDVSARDHAQSHDNTDHSTNYEVQDSTLTDIADGTIIEDLVNTNAPWGSDEIASDLARDSELHVAVTAATISGTFGSDQIASDMARDSELHAPVTSLELSSITTIGNLDLDSTNDQPLEDTLTDIADGTIIEDLVNTNAPWGSDEVASDLARDSELHTESHDNTYHSTNYEVADATLTDLADGTLGEAESIGDTALPTSATFNAVTGTTGTFDALNLGAVCSTDQFHLVYNTDTSVSCVELAGGGNMNTSTYDVAANGDIDLAAGGMDTDMSDPAVDAIAGWDDTENNFVYMLLGAGLSYDEGTDTLSSSGGGWVGTAESDLDMSATYQVVDLQAPAADGEAIRQTTNVTETNLNTLTGGGDTTLHGHGDLHTQGSDTTLGTMTADINMNDSFQVVSLQAPDTAGDAIRATTNITETNLENVTDGGDATAHDHAGISENTTARHAIGGDTTLGTMTADINMNTSYQLTALAAPVGAGEAVRTTAAITEVALIAVTDGGETDEHSHAGGGGDMVQADWDATTDGFVDLDAGGTNIDSSAVTNGQMLIGNTTGNLFALGTITGTATETDVTVGASSLQVGIVASPTLDATNITGGDIHAIGGDTTLGTMTADIVMDGSFQVTGLQAPDTAGDALRQTTNITEADLEELTDASETALHTHAGGSGDMTAAVWAEGVAPNTAIDQDAGGTNLDTSGVTNGQMLIGNTTSNVWALGTITGSTNELDVAVGTGTLEVGLVASPTTDATNITGPSGITALGAQGEDLDMNTSWTVASLAAPATAGEAIRATTNITETALENITDGSETTEHSHAGGTSYWTDNTTYLEPTSTRDLGATADKLADIFATNVNSDTFVTSAADGSRYILCENTNNTFTTEGYLCYDDTDDELQYYDNDSMESVPKTADLLDTSSHAAQWMTPDNADSNVLIFRAQQAGTVTGIECFATGGGTTIVVYKNSAASISDGTFTCTSGTWVIDTALTNTTIADDDYFYVDIIAANGASKIFVQVNYTE